MVRLVESERTRIDEVCSELVEEHPDWKLLDIDTTKKLGSKLEDLLGIKELENKTFVIPGYLVDARQFMSKFNKLVTYMAVQCRKRNWDLVVVAPNPKSIDIRLRNMLEEA